MKEFDLIDNETIKNLCKSFLEQNDRVESIFVGDVEGNTYYSLAKESFELAFNPELVLSNMASAIGIASNFFEKEFKDTTQSFTLFRSKHATVTVLYNRTILVCDVMTQPETTFEEKVKIEVYVEKMSQLAEKVDAVITSLGSIPFLEKLKQAMPKAKMLGIFTETGTPIHMLKSGLEDLDDAYVAAVSAALTISSQHVSESERQAMAVIGSRTMTLIRHIRSSSNIIPEQEDVADEVSQHRLLIVILPRDDVGVEHYFSLIESILRNA